MQHDCSTSGCRSVSEAPVRQENTETRKRRHLIQHKANFLYVLNTFSLHNHQLIATAVPSPLQLRIPVISNVQLVREDAAASVQQKKSAAARETATAEDNNGPHAADESDTVKLREVESDNIGGDAAQHNGGPGDTMQQSSGDVVQNNDANVMPVLANATSTSNATGTPQTTPIFEHVKKLLVKRKGTAKDKGPTKRRKKALTQTEVYFPPRLMYCMFSLVSSWNLGCVELSSPFHASTFCS